MLTARLFSRAVGFRTLMLNADKGGGSGGGEQKPMNVAELTQRVKDLETEKQTLDTKLKEANQAKDDATAAQQKAEGERDVANTAKDDAIKAQQKAESDRDAANTAKDDAINAQTKAETDLKTADERAEQKLREIDAKNGGTLPPKKPGAGDHTVDQPADQSLPPMKRLAAGMKVAGE